MMKMRVLGSRLRVACANPAVLSSHAAVTPPVPVRSVSTTAAARSGNTSPSPAKAAPSSQAAEEYDFIVAGAGSAGCLLANRLSARGATVLLLEAGGADVNPWIHIPIGYLFTMGKKSTDWCFKTTEQEHLKGREINYPRGRVMGGCSSINGMIYQRGQIADYDSWAESNPGWGWDDVLPYFNKHLDYAWGADELYSTGGEWRVEGPRVKWDVLDTFADAGEELGIPRVKHFNTSDEECSGDFQVNQRSGVRLSSYRAFLSPVLHRTNLHVQKGALVTGLESRDARVTGINYRVGGRAALARCRKEVILAAGAVGSPHILQLSGIGNESTLRQHNVSPILNLPGVGENLQDHLQIRAMYRLHGPDTRTLNEATHSWIAKAGMALQYMKDRSGPLSMAPSQLGMFARSSPDVATPDLQYHAQPLSLDQFGQDLHSFPGFTASVCDLRPSSRGSVSLSGPTVDSPPLIDPRYLTTERDQTVAVNAIHLTRRLMATRAMAKHMPEEIAPGVDVTSREGILESVADISTTIFHPVGTCKMGPNTDPAAVVDAHLKVHGTQGLRVVDGSIMPTLVSGNTNSPTLMIAEKASELILAEHGWAE